MIPEETKQVPALLRDRHLVIELDPDVGLVAVHVHMKNTAGGEKGTALLAEPRRQAGKDSTLRLHAPPVLDDPGQQDTLNTYWARALRELFEFLRLDDAHNARCEAGKVIVETRMGRGDSIDIPLPEGGHDERTNSR